VRRSHSLVDGYQLSKVTHENSGANRNSHYSVHYNCIYPVCANGKNLYLLRFTGSPVLEVCRILYRDSRQGAVSKRTTKFYGDLVSNFNNEDAGFAVDGDPSTRWTTEVVQANGMYFQLDFGAPASMSGVTLDSSGSRTGDAPVSFAVLISDDGVSFEVVASGNGDADGITTVSFDVRTARFLRIQQFGSSATNWWSIHEIVVDGLPDGPTDLVQIRQRSASNFGIASTDGGSLEQNVFLV